MSSPDSMKAADGLLPLPCNLLIGPLFLVAETAFALGLARDTRDAMAARAH